MGITIYPPQGGAGTGDVVGPAGSTTRAIATYGDTTGNLLIDNPLSLVDANGNVYAPNTARGYATTATAAGTTVLTVASKGVQTFTGATTQTVTLPVVSTLPQTGFGYWIINNSSDAVTVNSSGGNAVQVVAAGGRVVVLANALSGTSAAVWDKVYWLASSGDVTASGTLTSNAVMLGGGTTVVKAVAGITTDGVSILNVGQGGTSQGSVKFYNDDGSGEFVRIIPSTGALGDRDLTLPSGVSDTFAVLAAAQTLTNKTIDCDSNTVTNVARLKVDADNTLPATCAKGEILVLDNGTVWTGQATNDWQQVLTASDIGGVRAVTGTTDTVLSTDDKKMVTYSNASSIAVTLPQAGSGAPAVFVSGFYFTVENLGAGTVTITPTTSTINGGATLVLLTGQSTVIFSNGTNYLATSPVAVTGIAGLGSGVATFLATPSSANLASAVTGETGSGALVFADTPTLVTPLLGTPTSGTLTNCTGLPVAGITSSTSTALGVGSLELGAASDTTLSRSAAGVLAVEGVVIPSISSTNTLTNKRVTPRVGTTTSSATPTINTDNVDYYSLTAQTADITSFTTNLSGTPTDAQKLWISVTGTAARAITWGASFEASTVALPTTTVSTNRLDVGFIWNSATSKWRCVATA